MSNDCSLPEKIRRGIFAFKTCKEYEPELLRMCYFYQTTKITIPPYCLLLLQHKGSDIGIAEALWT